MRTRFPPGRDILLGPGDDAAVVRAPDGRVVATTDLAVDGVHFDRSYSSGYDVGRKVAAANLADVAAMGAVPTALLVGLAAPGELALAWALDLADGLAAEAGRAGCAVAGGDVTRSSRLVVSVTALGQLLGRDPVRRSGARVGDVLVVAGRLGWAAAGLALFRAGAGGPPAPGGQDPLLAQLLAEHRHPTVCYPAALRLAECHASSMIDVSDGLIGDAGHLAAASGVGIQLALADLPLGEPLRRAGRRLGVDPLGWVVGGGDDHAFLATLSDADALVAAVRLAALASPCPLVQIGRVVAGTGLHWTGGAPPAVSSHEHFRSAGR